jgi:hypothetical protein
MQLYFTLGAFATASREQTALANSKIRLFKSNITPTAGMTQQDLIDIEADYDDYPAGGATVTAMLNPLADPTGGASIQSPLTQFVCTGAQTTPNTIYGWWHETGAGVIVAGGTFPSGIPMANNNDGFNFSDTLVYGRNG